MKLKGIDVSTFQGSIDWGKVKKSGIDFAMIRAGFGKGTVDNKFIENICGANNAGIKIGVYWFIYALNEEDAIKNAEKCIETIKLYKDIIELGVAADYEYDSDEYSKKKGAVQTKESRSNIVRAFLSRLKKEGYEVFNYANPDYLKTKFEGLEEYPVWLAWYNGTEESIKKYNPVMWQYTSKGKVDGIKGNVDLDYLFLEEKGEKSDMPVLNVYSKAKQGANKLSENFKVKEFACKDGSDVVFVAPKLVEILQNVREHFGKPVNINSAYRTPTYNKKVGGSTYSQHQYGTAADIKINGVSPKDVAAYVETLLPNTGGIGIYSNFTHVDVRDEKSRWNG